MPPREQLGFAVRLVGVAAAAVAVFWLVVTLRTLLLAVLAALVLAAGLGRLSDWLERRGAPRVAAASAACLTVVVVLAALGTAVLVPLTEEVETLIRNLPAYRDAAVRALEGLERALPLLPPLHATLQETTQELIAATGEDPPEPRTLAQIASWLFSGAFGALFVVVTALYLLVDRERIAGYLLSFLPAARRPRAQAVVERVARQTGGWLAGQAVICAIVGIVTTIALALLGVRSAVLLGTVAALAELVPLVGPVTAAALGTLVAATQSPWQAAATLAFYVIFQQVDSYVLAPRILGGAVRLHPLAVILAVAVGAEVLGLVGALLAVPIATAASILLDEARGRRGGREMAAMREGERAAA